MTQRFTDKELATLANTQRKAFRTVSAQDLLNSVWINSADTIGSRKQQSDTQILSTATMTDVSVRLSFKDLLNVSSDWKSINHLKGDGAGPLSHDF